jgi:hypothetical protein
MSWALVVRRDREVAEINTDSTLINATTTVALGFRLFVYDFCLFLTNCIYQLYYQCVGLIDFYPFTPLRESIFLF